MVTTSRDKKLRIWDVRQERPTHEGPGHTGAKSSRAVWMGEHNRIATTGFSKMSDRQMGLWDVGNPSTPIGGFDILDSISGVCMPFWGEFYGNILLFMCTDVWSRRRNPMFIPGRKGVCFFNALFRQQLTVIVTATSDTSNMRMTSLSSCPSTSPVIHSVAWPSCQDVALT